MGKLIYGNASIETFFDDRVLAHLQIVIGAKLRRRESFFFSWKDDADTGSGRSSLWMDASVPLYFKYFGSKTPSINREWVRQLSDSANSGSGLYYIPEPDAQG
ncbi:MULTISPECIES: ATP-dependent DNA ligase [Subtercola]|uniref:ATP-dependent DNA ligase n=1 Tax=Subtercola vilae TaxID=2056433 RepID=A0A4T2C8U9_9MICO|nr:MULTISPECIES: ATP-dependent DNA ligase [Subtercola]MEA9986819.1 ATP-dependent DNA ligase [Subtercola sp. RTI3]TIH40369.1 ATP-dependent DNA ligase [Subtercola vilae]